VTDFLGIIPARYASTRFPGKPLAQLGNKPLIQWVYERSSQVFEQLVVATDDSRIFKAVTQFGGEAIMTSSTHCTGTERCAEAYSLIRKEKGRTFSHVVNIQGDEPLIHPDQLQNLQDCFQEPGTGIATLIRPMNNQADLTNPNVVKVVVDQSFRALYFSRSSIPFVRDPEKQNRQDTIPYYHHIGLYAFRAEILEQVVTLPATPLELAESLEQLRWMEHGIPIQTSITHYASQGVDTPEDLEKVRALI
jgi:3-deoxy-manno-octulosonate cytidylyltransferase (CMP-KDO synthetase)